MKTIKTREVTHNVKKLDKAIAWTERIKDPAVYLNEKSKDVVSKDTNTVDYGADKIKYYTNRAKDEVIYTSKKGVTKTKNQVIKQFNKKKKQSLNKIKSTKAKKQKIKKTQEAAKKTKELAVKTAKATAKATEKTVKIIAKAIVSAVKAIIQAFESLAAAIGVGGAVALIVVILICLVALLLASPFGIFFLGSNDSQNTKSSMLISDCNNELDEKIENIKKSKNGHYKEVKIVDNRALTKDILIIYSVKNNSNMSVDLSNVNNQKLFKQVFNDMNVINYNIKDEILTITIESLSIDEIEKKYKFDKDQRNKVNELLSSKYNKYLDSYNNSSPFFTDGYWAWPNSCRYISSPYGPRDGKLHNGLDIACRENCDIYAAQGGIVIESRRGGDSGEYIIIRHENDFYTMYGHLNTRLVFVGEGITKGQVIGKEGSTGNSTGPHLHFSIWKGYPYAIKSYTVNPINYFKNG